MFLRSERARDIFQDIATQFDKSELLNVSLLIAEFANAFDLYKELSSLLDKNGRTVQHVSDRGSVNDKLNPLCVEEHKVFQRAIELAKQLKITPKTKGDEQQEIDLSSLILKD